MDSKTITTEGKLVYASRSEDKNFRSWSLSKTVCYITYYQTLELTKLDKVILMTLQFNESSLHKNKLANILGFNVQDDFNVTPKRYKDEGEVSIFAGLLNELVNYGLIQIAEHKVQITPLGHLSLKKNVKYVFFSGAILLNESYDLAQKTEHDYLFFPFRDALGIISKIQCGQKLEYADFNVNNIEQLLYGEHDELVSRLSLQTAEEAFIFKAEISTDARMGVAYVDYRLYEYNNQKYPLVFYNDSLSQEANNLMYDAKNADYVKSKIHIGDYLYLVRESGVKLTHQTLSLYMDVWNLDDFIDSPFMDWNDPKLFDCIASAANGSQWSSISSICPTESLKPLLKKYEENLDWIIISGRYDDDFIVENAVVYPWDIESLSSSRSIEFVKRIIVIPELHADSIDWDWETLMPQLDDEFVLRHIQNIPFVMFSQTEKFLTNHPDSIVSFPDRNWDWNFISKNAPLSFLLENMDQIGKFVYIEDIMPRAFVDETWSHQYCESSTFAFATLDCKERLTTNYNANSANYAWSTELIDWHEKMGFVSWKSSTYSEGLECNPYIKWTNEFFTHYKGKEFSIKGLNHISESIEDCITIDSNLDFKWSWPILSKRDIVLGNLDFIKAHLNQLSLDIIISSLDETDVDRLYSVAEFKNIVSIKNLWPIVTERVSESVIRYNFKDPNWNWKVLTKRFCSTMQINQLGDPRWVDKLDWDYLSENLEITIIQDHLSLYSDRWNWDCLTSRVEHDFLLSNMPEYYNFWNWNKLLKSILTDDDLADESTIKQIAIILSQLEEGLSTQLWSLFTSRFTTEGIFNLLNNQALRTVGFKWDYKDIYNRSDFDIESYLDNYLEREIAVDWDELSSSKALDRILRWDKNITKDFRNWEDLVKTVLERDEFEWNFAYLSTLTSINWCDNILKIRIDEWDWDYLSENSKCFSFNSKKPQELIKHIEKFDDHLNFAILSKRKDVKLSLDILCQHLNYSWDWTAISDNKSIELSEAFISEHKDFLWDWSALSSRYDCKFTIKFIQENKDKDWNWQTLSRRKDIKFSTKAIMALYQKEWDWSEIVRRKDVEPTPELLRHIIDKEIDWKMLSQRDDFYPSIEMLNILKDKNIDWSGISRREDLDYNVILLYKEKLDWKILSHSSHIDISKTKVLETFEDYLDWSFVSSSPNFSLSIESLEKFQDKLNWSVLCKRKDFNVTEEILEKFTARLDWTSISRSGIIKFTQQLVDKFKDKWDWVALSENPSFKSSGLEAYFKQELNLTDFYNELKFFRHEKPYIYHFTHMFNAIEVIRTRKILSRNRAKELGLLKYDAAGSVVHRSAKAHPYARFYYRTGTQTQFYNECLGKQRNTKYYQSALGNGLPMCPMPVFFKFDLQEVLSKCSNLCSYSTGNLQTNWASVHKVIEDPHYIDAQHLYSSNNYDKVVRDKKQQEFLVKNEFDFSDINNFQIICYDREETEILRSIFRDDPICQHIFSIYDEVEDVFEHENPQLMFNFENNCLSVATRYTGDYIFQIESSNVSKIHVLNTKDIKAQKKNVIQLYNSVSIELSGTPFDVYYVNMSPAARSPRWLIYQHVPAAQEVRYTPTEEIEKYLGISFDDKEFSPEELITSLELALPKLEGLYNTQVRHYVIKLKRSSCA